MEHTIFSFGAEMVLGKQTTVCKAAEDSLNHLIAGNKQYLAEQHTTYRINQVHRESTAKNGQTPYAVIVCCSDSRVPPEHIFQAGLGDLFVIRNAGNLLEPYSIGSVEYAVEHLGVPLVVVMGHIGCGAVASALAGHTCEGKLQVILHTITEAIGDTTDPREAERRNLFYSMSHFKDSAILQEYLRAGKVAFAAAIYDICSGQVEFLQS